MENKLIILEMSDEGSSLHGSLGFADCHGTYYSRLRLYRGRTRLVKIISQSRKAGAELASVSCRQSSIL